MKGLFLLLNNFVCRALNAIDRTRICLATQWMLLSSLVSSFSGLSRCHGNSAVRIASTIVWFVLVVNNAMARELRNGMRTIQKRRYLTEEAPTVDAERRWGYRLRPTARTEGKMAVNDCNFSAFEWWQTPKCNNTNKSRMRSSEWELVYSASVICPSVC